MGSYTELIFGAELKCSTPENVINTIKWMLNELEEQPSDLDFEPISRNPLLGGSYYFGVNISHTNFYFDKIRGAWVLSSRANIKNYDGDIERFLEWIKPYVSSGSGYNEMYAIVIHEEAKEPTIYYLYNEVVETYNGVDICFDDEMNTFSFKVPKGVYIKYTLEDCRAKLDYLKSIGEQLV